MERLQEAARKVFEIEIQALGEVSDNLNDCFEEIVEQVCTCQGNVILTGMGKSGHIAKKIAATLSSLGTPSFYLHPAEARHGDLGMVTAKDVVIAISNSGETEEVLAILPNLKRIGASVIGIASNAKSSLLLNSDIAYPLPELEEACYLKLAPTSSTTAALVLGDAIAVCASMQKGFTKDNFALFHPSGALGKRLLTHVRDVMICGTENATISEDSSLKEAIIELAQKGLGVVNVTREDGTLAGVFTDGDLRRLFAGSEVHSLDEIEFRTVVSTNPITIEGDKLSVDALKLMQDRKVSSLPVLENGKLCGTVLLRDVV